MIDIENYIVTKIEEAVTAEYPGADVLADYIEKMAAFPTVTVTQIQNETLRRMQDEEPTEHYARVTFEVNVYCNDRLGKKAGCKRILDLVDGVMFPMKFTRRPLRQLPAIDHSRTIYRMYARYTAVVDEGTVVEEDGEEKTVYHMYRG